MKIDFKSDGTPSASLSDFAQHHIPETRQQLIHEIATDILSAVADGTPIDTGRSQASWQAAADGDARNPDSETSLIQGDHQTEFSATNSVPYMAYLEYGTANHSPVAMIRTALSSASQFLSALLNRK